MLAVHPTQIYETLIMLAVFAFMWSRRSAHGGTGWIFGVYLMFAGIERFLVEFLRAKDDRFVGPLSVAQLTSMLVALAGVAIMVRLRAPARTKERYPSASRPPRCRRARRRRGGAAAPR